MPLYVHEESHRTDCVECGKALYYRVDDTYGCMAVGNVKVVKLNRDPHFLLFMGDKTFGSCRIWPDLDRSIEKVKRYEDDDPPF